MRQGAVAPILAVSSFAIGLLLAADTEEPWPRKGDLVFVSAELTGVFGAPPIVQFRNITSPACSPMRVAFQPKPKGLLVEDTARGATFKLCEGWTALIHPTVNACTVAQAARPILLMKHKGCYRPAEPPPPKS